MPKPWEAAAAAGTGRAPAPAPAPAAAEAPYRIHGNPKRPAPQTGAQVEQDRNSAAASQYAPAIARQNLDQGAASIASNQANTANARRQPVNALWQEYQGNPVVREWQTARTATKQLQRLAIIPPDAPERAIADIALVFSFMKVVDPPSTIREGEYATAKNSAGVSEQVRNQYNAVLNGQFLSPRQRTGFAKVGQELYRSRSESYNETAQIYRRRMQQLGANPREIPIATPDNGAPLRPPGRGAPARVRTTAEWQALPPGTTYVGPDGRVRRKR